MWRQVATYFNPLCKSIGNIREMWSGSSLLGNITFPQIGLQQVRTNVRQHFPRASEHKRIKRHGYKTRMSTPGGRRIIMRRILKGRHVLSH